MGAVIFPHNIGLGTTRSSEPVEKINRAIAVEVRATGANWTIGAHGGRVEAAQDVHQRHQLVVFGSGVQMVEQGVAGADGIEVAAGVILPRQRLDDQAVEAEVFFAGGARVVVVEAQGAGSIRSGERREGEVRERREGHT